MKADIIIILGYAVKRTGELLDVGKWRVEKGSMLYKEGIANKILMLGGKGKHFNNTNKSLAHWMKKYAIGLGVPSRDILLEEHSFDTKENIIFANRTCRMNGWKNIIFVTSGPHACRVKKLVEEIFKDKYKVTFATPRIKLRWWLFETLWEISIIRAMLVRYIRKVAQ